MLNYDAAHVARLDSTYSTPQIIDQRLWLRSAIKARPGEVGLDVGCGAGHLACELAREVAPGGRIIAIDKSRDSVDASKARVAKEELTNTVVVHIGDATVLDFSDETFDFVVGAQIYSFIPNIAGAIREAARVLRKGGRLVVLDSDWDMCIWKSKDPILTRHIISARAASQYAHAHLPRDLNRLFIGAGLTLVDAQAFSIIETRYDPNSYGVSIIDITREEALKYGVPALDVAAWEEDLRSRTAEGEWFFCLDRFIFTGRKNSD